MVWQPCMAGVVGLVIGGPVGLAAGATIGEIVAYEFERKMWKHIQETVKKMSQVQPTLSLWIHIISKDYETYHKVFCISRHGYNSSQELFLGCIYIE